MISSYYKGAHGIILVYDYTNVKSFYSLKNWMKEIKHFASETAVKYLVCNKIDCISHDTTINSLSNWTVSDEVSYTSKFIAQEAEKFAIQNSMKYLKTSALNNVGVYDLFKSITSDIVDNCDDEKIKCRSESIKLGYINNEYFNSGIVPKETVQRPSQYSCCNF